MQVKALEIRLVSSVDLLLKAKGNLCLDLITKYELDLSSILVGLPLHSPIEL